MYSPIFLGIFAADDYTGMRHSCQGSKLLGFDSYEEFILPLGNGVCYALSPHCMVKFYFCLSFIDVLVFNVRFLVPHHLLWGIPD